MQVAAGLPDQVVDAPATLRQLRAEGVKPAAGSTGGDQPTAQGVEEPVGGGVEEARLVGEEAVGGAAVGGAGEAEILDAALRVSPVILRASEGSLFVRRSTRRDPSLRSG